MTLPKSFPLIPCQKPFWAPERHTQTILGDFLPSFPLSNPGEKWLLNLPDGDRLVCRVHERSSPWVVCLAHGLTGSAQATYMQRIAGEFLKLGHSVVLMNHRNCGEGKGLARHPYHCGKSDDLGFVTAQIRRRFRGKKVLSVGFSMSANGLLLLMSRVVPSHGIFETGDFDENAERLHIDRPDAAITVNAPIHLERTAVSINRRLNRIYEMKFMTDLNLLIRELEKQGILEPSKGLHPLMKITNFDDRFTAPKCGFQSARHYYETCSARHHVHKIDRPTVCLMARNDPFIDHRDYLETKFSPLVRLHIEHNGGHMGYLHKEKTPLGTNRWLDYGVVEIAKRLFEGS